MSFRFVDLFAGIGGFHAALGDLGGDCVMASEIDRRAVEVYVRNWGSHMNVEPSRPLVEGDIVSLTERDTVAIPEHDVLAAGFPCQPFSKSGFQRGMEETRGTLFYNILKVLEARRPKVLILENVRNLAGPRHRHEWRVIVHSLRDLGYKVSDRPAILSPHLLPPALGGAPQFRERVFITGTHVGADRAWAEADVEAAVENRPALGWSPESWDLDEHLLMPEGSETAAYSLTDDETRIIDIWNDFVERMRAARGGKRLPGFPIWADALVDEPALVPDLPRWKEDFLLKNSAFYRENRRAVTAWRRANPQLQDLPPSRRKLEWQAQDTPRLWDTVMHFRPSGIRAKRPTYLPALVAITQTSIIGSRRRRITPREAARLQSLPDWFDFGDQPDQYSYRQLGNAVSAGVAAYVFRAHLSRDRADLPPSLADLAIEDASPQQLRLVVEG